MHTKFSIVVAVDAGFGIARDGAIPWSDTPEGKDDLRWFSSFTQGWALIMGRRTYSAIGRSLPGRVIVVMSSRGGVDSDSVKYANDFESALRIASVCGQYVGVCGGADIYGHALGHRGIEAVFMNRINGDYNCDLKFPALTEGFEERSAANKPAFPLLRANIPASMQVYHPVSVNADEDAYLEIMEELLAAPLRENRTGIPTHGLFARMLRFQLSDDGPILPLLTTKRVPFRAVAHELAWFLSGKCTDISYLQKHNVHIWDDNTTPEFHRTRGLDYSPGECGPIYGFQWRNWGVLYRGYGYTNCNDSSDIPIYDQISTVIETLKTDPMCRRMIVSAWNVAQLHQMVLPPCHWSFQFHCTEYMSTVKLNCIMNMRSADVALGVPFNIASYALLVHIIAHICGYTPGELVIVMADCHLYSNHVDGARIQLSRRARKFPRISIVDGVNTLEDFIAAGPDAFIVDGYHPHGVIKYSMAV